MENHDLFKFADIISDVIADYFNGETTFENEKEVLRYIERMCTDQMEKSK